jgi:chemotaxis regulatin CheY-phosphate phosphatase CheZ
MGRTCLAAGIAVAALVTFACTGGANGDDTLTLAEYFAELERISHEAESRLDRADVSDVENPSVDEARNLWVGALKEAAATFDDTVDELEDLNPPGEVEDEHDEFTGDLRRLSPEFERWIARVEDIETFQELIIVADEIDDFFAGVPEQDRFTESCNALQRIADENDVSVDLECES